MIRLTRLTGQQKTTSFAIAVSLLPPLVGNDLSKWTVPSALVLEAVILMVILAKRRTGHLWFWLSVACAMLSAAGWAYAWGSNPTGTLGGETVVIGICTAAQTVAVGFFGRPYVRLRPLRPSLLLTSAAFVSGVACNQALQPWLREGRDIDSASSILRAMMIVSVISLFVGAALLRPRLLALGRPAEVLVVVGACAYLGILTLTIVVFGVRGQPVMRWTGPMLGFAFAISAASHQAMPLIGRPIEPLPESKGPMLWPIVLAILLFANPFLSQALSQKHPSLALTRTLVGVTLTEAIALVLMVTLTLRRRRHDVASSKSPSRRAQALRLNRDITAALVGGQICPVYQPIVLSQTGEIAGYEALARWHHPTHGIIAAGSFIAVIEEAGYLPMFDRVMIYDVARALPLLRVKAANNEAVVTVNVAMHQMESVGFAQEILDGIAGITHDPAGLTFELSESDRVTSWDQLLDNIAQVRAHGIAVAVDDFGAGFANLASMSRINPDIVKLDGQIVTEGFASASGRALLTAAVAAARSGGAKVVAESVENARWAPDLYKMGVHYLQGYAVGMPEALPENDQTSGSPGILRS